MDSNNSSILSEQDNQDKERSHHHLDPRFECPICLNCLKEPYLTSCGHRFCQECILEWLRKKNRRHCPVDSTAIEERDIFPDNYTKREITQQTVRCTFPDCDSTMSLLDVEAHVSKFHENNIPSNLHMNGTESLAKAANSWDAPPKSQNNQSQLVMSLFERIVRLEQKSREQELQLANARSVINEMKHQKEQLMSELPLRICNGSHVWNVKGIREKLNSMMKDPSEMFYSEGFYTSYNGYRFCARLNISPNNSSYVSLLVHLMKSENDDVLPWPFKGRISFTLVHPTIPDASMSEVMCTKPGLKAFEKPVTSISPRAFGYTEFMVIDDIINKGYIKENGSVNIKIDIICV